MSARKAKSGSSFDCLLPPLGRLAVNAACSTRMRRPMTGSPRCLVGMRNVSLRRRQSRCRHPRRCRHHRCRHRRQHYSWEVLVCQAVQGDCHRRYHHPRDHRCNQRRWTLVAMVAQLAFLAVTMDAARKLLQLQKLQEARVLRSLGARPAPHSLSAKLFPRANNLDGVSSAGAIGMRAAARPPARNKSPSAEGAVVATS